jgi:alpha-D-ribose 1-methylphosphonate 5-triphosphate diphosphatase PhnM
MGQMRSTDILLKSFEYRYDKIQGKNGNMNDVLSYDYQKHSIFNQRCSDLAGLEVKMSTIEQKLGLIEQKIDGLIDLTQKRKLEEGKQKENIINTEETTEKKQDIKIEESIKIEDLRQNENK